MGKVGSQPMSMLSIVMRWPIANVSLFHHAEVESDLLGFPRNADKLYCHQLLGMINIVSICKYTFSAS